MGEKWDKFLLLMWKNWVMQYRKPIQTIIEIMAPVIFSILLVIIRGQADPELQQDKNYSPFCVIPFGIDIRNSKNEMLCPNVDGIPMYNENLTNLNTIGGKLINIVYSPSNSVFDEAADIIKQYLKVNVTGEENAAKLQITAMSTDTYNIGIEFPDKYTGVQNWDKIDDLSIALRFPAEVLYQMDSINANPNWLTNLVYPLFQSAGPRSPDNDTGAGPSYFKEQFLFFQYLVTNSLVMAKKNITNPDSLFTDNFPLIQMRRFPYSSWYSDYLLTAIEGMLALIIMLSFVYTCINTVKTITTEKEKQLKESMKIMGLPNWLHWTAWFIKCVSYLTISIILVVALLKIRFYDSKYTVFTYADASVLFVFFFLYAISTVTFSFALSVFFSKANTAATMAGLFWFLSYTPFLFMQNNYAELSLGIKLITSLFTNTAMAFGFQVVLMYEGTGEGVSWSNLFTSNTPDDNLNLGLIFIMLVVNSIMYLLIALYVEAVFPGEYGVPLKPYYFLTKTYWCGSNSSIATDDEEVENNNEYFEKEPTHLKAGIKIRNLRKVFGKKAAVRNLSLNMFEDQITVLLGHNGAGKTTTMSMLTGMITPTSGTANINGYDIKTEMGAVRNSLGLCPQHNIIFDDLTVEEHFYFFSKLKGLSRHEVKDEINKYVKLLDFEPKRNSKASTLSGGMKRKLCVGIALCGRSKVIMLDEPTAGMDPSARRVLWELIQKEKEGRTMLLSTHFMDEADLLGDRIAIMAGGELQCCGSSFFLKKKYGAGYSLIMDKSKDCDPKKVTVLLQKYIPEIEIHSNVGSELSYLLTDNYASIFETMLNDLEEHSNSLGIRSYGISLTTLEEVFLKVGADHGQEEEYNERDAQTNTKTVVPNYEKTPVSLVPTYFSGMKLLQNQVLAMLLKKGLGSIRSWILFVIQICIPMINLIIALSIPNPNLNSEGLPAMPLDLNKFSNPVILMNVNDESNYSSNYKSVLSGYTFEEADISERMLYLTRTTPNLVRRRYIIGASFSRDNFTDVNDNTKTIHYTNVTAWFNNDAYHSPGIALSYVLSAVYKQDLFNCIDCSNYKFDFTNKPLPYTGQTQIRRIMSGQSQGFQMAFNICFSMAFVSAFYVIFLVREKVTKSKHLQFVSGVDVFVFWVVHAVWDFATYFITIIVMIVTLICFQQDGFKTPEQLGIMFVILFYFGCAFLPLTYLASFYFDVPSTGFTRMTLISIFTGSVAFLVVTILGVPALKLTHVADGLHWPMLLFPHYSLASGINEYFTKFQINNLCDNFFYPYLEECEYVRKIPYEQCLASAGFADICTGIDSNYFSWKANGIGRNVLFSIVSGVVFFIILLAVEYKVFARFTYYIDQKFFPKFPVPNEDEDDDVAKEKEVIRNATESELQHNYTLVIKDLTKYYKKFLAVNGLSMGVGKYECFGLLGVNGAGKTTTFKMMSGDEKISYGDGWISGKSIKTQLKQIQKNIGYCPQFDALLNDMTAKETIIMYCLLRGIELKRTHRIADFLSKEFDFYRHLNKKVKDLSGGNKRKLSTVLSLIGDPPVIFLDEPTTGMDPATKRYLWDSLCKIRDSGKTIVLTSHSMEECEALCTRVAIMVNGNFKCLGSTQHLKNKFAEGYTLTIKMKKLPESSGMQHADTDEIEKFIQENFPGAHLRERHQELLNYYIVDKSMPWSKMFGILERAKRSDLNIEDYSLGQSSLEQVFLTFTKNQIEEE